MYIPPLLPTSPTIRQLQRREAVDSYTVDGAISARYGPYDPHTDFVGEPFVDIAMASNRHEGMPLICSGRQTKIHLLWTNES
jgi:hypothetical protein